MAQTTYKLVAKGTLNGQALRNIYYVRFDDPLGVNSPNTLFDTYLNAIYNIVKGPMTTTTSFSDYDIYKLETNKWTYQGSRPLAYTGQTAGEGLPNQDAAVILGKVLGRRGFGRKFFAGFSEGAQANSYWTAGNLAALVNAAAAYIAQVVDAGLTLTPGVVDKNFIFHIFTSAVVDALVGSQRRRKIGVGL